MTEEKTSGKRYNVPFFGIVLLFLGIVFLLQTMRALPWDLWLILWRYWPVLIICFGLILVLRNMHAALVGLIIGILLFASLGVSVWQYNSSGPLNRESIYRQPIGDVTNAVINMNLNVGEFKIGGIETGSANLFETASDAQIGHGAFDTRISRSGSVATAEISARKAAGLSGSIKLTKQIPLSVSLNAGASAVIMDLSSLQVSEITVKADAGHYVITMPEKGTIAASVKSGLGNVEIIIPDTIAARIQLNSADMSVVEIDRKRFIQNGNTYTSADFNTAQQRIELKIESAIGRVSVR